MTKGEVPHHPSFRELMAAAAAGGLYGSIQAAIPSVGELAHVTVIHLTASAVFFAAFVPAACGSARLLVTLAYICALAAATQIPVKFYDRHHISVQSTTVALRDLPQAIRAAGIAIRPRGELPDCKVRFSSRTPTLREVNQALRDQLEYQLQPVPICGNAISASFLWGTRLDGRRFFLRPTTPHAGCASPPNSTEAVRRR